MKSYKYVNVPYEVVYVMINLCAIALDMYLHAHCTIVFSIDSITQENININDNKGTNKQSENSTMHRHKYNECAYQARI